MKKRMYKLTDQNMQTHRGFQWKLGEVKTTSGKGDLCGPGWLHCYTDPLLAVLLNPIHADIQNPRLFLAEVSGKSKHDHGLKSGYTRMTLIKEIPVPDITTENRVKFGIFCALEGYRDPGFIRWAEGWISGADRSENEADAASGAARAAAGAAWAADAAGEAARAATRAAWAADAAAWAATWAAWAAADAAAEAATWAAGAAADAAAGAVDIDLVDIAHKSCDDIKGVKKQ